MIHLTDTDMAASGFTILAIAAWCWATSTTYRAQRVQRAENRTHRQQRLADRRYARTHRCNR